MTGNHHLYFTDSFTGGVADRPKDAGLLRSPDNFGKLGALKARCGRKMNRSGSWLYRAWDGLWGRREIFLVEKWLANFSASELADSRQCPQHWHSPGVLGLKELASQRLGFELGKNKDQAVKNPPFNVGDLVSIPGLGRSPGGGHGNPLQYSCLENPHGQRSLVGYSAWGHRVGLKWLSMQAYRHAHTHTHAHAHTRTHYLEGFCAGWEKSGFLKCQTLTSDECFSLNHPC